MVYPLFVTANKTEGESNKTSLRAANGNSGSEGFTGGSSRSGDNICLSNSTEELLNLELDSNLHTPTLTSQQHRSVTTSTLEDGFSIDSRDKYYPQEAPNEPKNHRWHRWSRSWKAVKRRSGSQLTRILKMGLKRYYLLLLCLILVIVSCLIASFAISRSVGELDSDDSSSSSSHDATGDKPVSHALGLSLVDYERRSIDLIDLIQCGKTFAYTKIRIQVRVPKSSQVYQQQPAFLQQQTTLQPQKTEIPNDGFPVQQHDIKPVKFVLTNPRDVTTTIESADQLEAGASEHSPGAIEGSTAASISTTTTPTTPINPIAIDIKPVKLPSVPGASREASATHSPLKELTTLLTASVRGTESEASTESPPPVMELIGDSLKLDPLEAAASEMKVLSASINRTLVDCFFVDIEKRFWQKVAFEDKYRHVVSTRKVPFDRMMQALIECRHLTWSSLPPIIKVKEVRPAVASGDKPLVAAASATTAVEMAPSSDLSPPTSNGMDFIGAMLGSWLHGNNGASSGVDTIITTTTTTTTAVASEPSGAVVAAAEAQLRPQTVALNSMNSDQNGATSEEERRQGSYLNMGISMVSGIVPNTLWCGLGDRASNYSELGAEFQVDSCCRTHDHCPIRLRPFSADYGLVNWSVSTRSHCDCDIDFSNCLKSVNSTLSNVIRVLYFRFVGLQCIDVEGRDSRDE